jgi:hypothetical protein
VTRRAIRSITRIWSASRWPRWKGLPDGGQVGGEPAGPGEQAAHLVRLVAQHQRQFIGHKLTRLGTVEFRRTWAGGCNGFGDSLIGVTQRRSR